MTIPVQDAVTHSGVLIFKGEAINCEQCGYVHLDPLPSQEELDAHWNELYAGGYLYEQERGQQWYWKRTYRERMKRFDKLAKQGILLDYGAGIGNFVTATRWQYGWWSVYGYEPNVIARSGRTSLYSVSPLPGIYNGVHCSLVLEHALDPCAVLRHVWELLVPGGVACIVVPNEFNRLQQRLYEWGYSPLHPHHCNYFTQESLTRLVESAGFEVVETTATFPIEVLALAGLNYVKHPGLGIVAHWLRMLFETALMLFAGRLKRILYRWFAKQGIGREIVLWGRKKIT